MAIANPVIRLVGIKANRCTQIGKLECKCPSICIVFGSELPAGITLVIAVALSAAVEGKALGSDAATKNVMTVDQLIVLPVAVPVVRNEFYRKIPRYP
jgi:hypothetical protein